MVGAAKKVGAGLSPQAKHAAWPLFAAACWAGTMGMWEADRTVLQRGLVGSMDFIYRDSDKASARGWGGLLDWTEWLSALSSR